MSADSDSIPDDKDMFDAAVAETPAEPEPQAEPEKPEPEAGQPRDDRGRFATKAEREAAEQAQRQDEPEQRRSDGMVPSARLREEAEARRTLQAERETERKQWQEEMAAMRRDLALMRQPPQQRPEPVKPPDLIENPEGYADYLQQQVEHRYRKARIDETFEDARDANPEGFEKAWDSLLRANPNIRNEIIAAPNPGKALMRWHQREAALSEIGPDLGSYRKRIEDQALERAMADPDFRQKVIDAARGEAGLPANRPNNVTKLPPSLNRATGARSNENDDTTPMSEAELFRHVTSR